MNYKVFDEVYKENKKLDKMFDDSFKDLEMIKKNKLELLVEIGELANETRYFKYWSSKPMNIELVEKEFADCMIICLYFFNILNINLDDEFKNIDKEYDNVDIFARLYELASNFYYDNSKDIIKEYFVTLIKLGHMIGFSDKDICNCCLSKIITNQKRFKDGF